MECYARVFDHPYYAVTDAEGRFEIKNVPVGQWRLFVWHEGHGWRGGRMGRNGYRVEVKQCPVTDLGDWALNPPKDP